MDKTPGWVKTASWLLVVAGVLFLLSEISSLVKLVVVAALLAYILDPVACLLESRGMSRTWATVLIFLSICLVVVVFILNVVPNLVSEVESVKSEDFTARLTPLIKKIEGFINHKAAFFGAGEVNLLEKINRSAASFGDRLIAYALDMFSVMAELLLLPFIVFFLLKDGRAFKKKLISMVPNRHFEFSLNLIHKMDMQLGNYLRGQVLDCIIIGVISTVALWALGVKYYYAIGVFAGLANIVPYFGPIAGAALAATVSVIDTGDAMMVLYIGIAFAFIKLVDDAAVQPLIMSRMVHLHPLMIFLGIIIGGKFFGVLGMLLSVPVTAIVKVTVHETLYSYRKYYQARPVCPPGAGP